MDESIFDARRREEEGKKTQLSTINNQEQGRAKQSRAARTAQSKHDLCDDKSIENRSPPLDPPAQPNSMTLTHASIIHLETCLLK